MMRVRAARPDDDAFVVGLVPRFAEHGPHPGHSRDEVIGGTSRVLRDALHAPAADAFFAIAEDENAEPLGFVYAVSADDFFTGRRYAHVSEIAVVRSGEGIGGALMAAAESWARDRGYPQITLNTVEANDGARRMYERLGYAPAYRQLYRRLD